MAAKNKFMNAMKMPAIADMQRTTFESAAMLPLNTLSRETIWISSKSIKLQRAAANIAL